MVADGPVLGGSAEAKAEQEGDGGVAEDGDEAIADEDGGFVGEVVVEAKGLEQKEKQKDKPTVYESCPEVSEQGQLAGEGFVQPLDETVHTAKVRVCREMSGRVEKRGKK